MGTIDERRNYVTGCLFHMRIMLVKWIISFLLLKLVSKSKLLNFILGNPNAFIIYTMLMQIIGDQDFFLSNWTIQGYIWLNNSVCGYSYMLFWSCNVYNQPKCGLMGTHSGLLLTFQLIFYQVVPFDMSMSCKVHTVSTKLRSRSYNVIMMFVSFNVRYNPTIVSYLSSDCLYNGSLDHTTMWAVK